MTALLIWLAGVVAMILVSLWLLPKWLEARQDARTARAQARMLEQTGGHTVTPD
jgi:ferric-dicitrate binding protein FerR (iron transport regulator)